MSSANLGKSSVQAVLETGLPETSTLKFVSRGKVRDLYEIREREGEGGEEYLLFVATDRISAFDVVLNNVRYESTTVLNLSLLIPHLSQGYSRQRRHAHIIISVLVSAT